MTIGKLIKVIIWLELHLYPQLEIHLFLQIKIIKKIEKKWNIIHRQINYSKKYDIIKEMIVASNKIFSLI